MILYRPKSTYRVIAFLLVVALIVCLLSAPSAKADPLVIGTVSVGVFVVGLIASLMGADVSNKSDFSAACQSC